MGKFVSNLRFLRKTKSVSQEIVADELDIPRSRFASYEEGRAEPPYDMLIKISDYYHVSIDALLKGDFSKTNPDDLLKVGKNRVLFPILMDEKKNDLIEVINAKASAGYLNGYADPEYIEKLPVMQLPFAVLGKQRAFPIKGDSMPPLQSGDYVVGKYIELPSEIMTGKTYVLVTKDEGIIYKRVVKKNQNAFELHSDNKAYEPYSVKTSGILEAWEFVCSVNKSDSGNEGEEMNLESVMKVLREMQAEMKEIKWDKEKIKTAR